VIFDNKLNFESHIESVVTKTSRVIDMMSKARHFLPIWSLDLLYKALIQSHIIYASNVYGFTYETHIKRLKIVQKRAAKTILFKNIRTSSLPLFSQLRWLNINNLIRFYACLYIHKSVNNLLCKTSNEFFNLSHRRSTRSDCMSLLSVPNYKTQYCRNSIFYKGIELWNNVDINLRNISKFNYFKKNLFNFIFNAQFE
jgi:hypothetical protein